MTDQERIRANLRRFVTEKGMTQAEFAQQLGMQRPPLNRVLTGAQRITPDFVGKFFLAYPNDAPRIFDVNPEPTEVPA